MKRLSGILLITVFILTGCVATNVQRGVKGDTFYSTFPRLAVQFAPEFEYINKKKQNGFTGNTHYGPRRQKYEQYTFADNLTRTITLISIKQLERGNYLSDLNFGINNLLDAGVEEQNGKRYQYSVYTYNHENENCLLIKRYAILTGSHDQIVMEIFYAETLDAGINTCSQWRQASLLTAVQKKILNKFLKNCKEKMQFVDLPAL